MEIVAMRIGIYIHMKVLGLIGGLAQALIKQSRKPKRQIYMPIIPGRIDNDAYKHACFALVVAK